jgi:ligand-binding sensor domain-containing protein
MKSVGTSDIKGTKESKLSESWTVFNQSNSKLPWDMSRVALTDKNNTLWIGTDNGIAVMKGENMEILNSKNSKLRPTKYNKNRTSSIRGGAVDQLNNKWFFGGYEVYKFDNKNWTVFDSLNSPIGWMRKIHIDKKNNVFLTSSKGVVKYDGNNWSTINTSNSKLPSNKASGVFVDSKERLWIGTYDGNIRIDNDNTTEFNNSESPLKEGAISEMYEDKSGNLWFDLYNNDDKSKGGMFILRTNGQWESIRPKNSKLFTINDINNFLLDEDKNILWIALNSVGLIKYDITNDKWETYTTENSNVPSIHVMQLTKDENGTIWAATFAGLIKLNAE